MCPARAGNRGILRACQGLVVGPMRSSFALRGDSPGFRGVSTKPGEIHIVDAALTHLAEIRDQAHPVREAFLLVRYCICLLLDNLSHLSEFAAVRRSVAEWEKSIGRDHVSHHSLEVSVKYGVPRSLIE